MHDITNVNIGERVIYVDDDGETHNAVVVDDVPDSEYLTLVWGGDQGELGEEYHSDVEVETSVYPHRLISDGATAETHAFFPQYWTYEGEYDNE